MNTRTYALRERRANRVAITIAALVALSLSLMYLARPVAVQAAGTVNIDLQASQHGSDSTTFDKEQDCGDFTTGVVWHFILNNFDAGTPAGTLTAQFASASDVTVSASKVLSNVQHFYVNTPSNDVLDDAWATIDEMQGQADAKLVLSHVCDTGHEGSQSPEESQPEQSQPEQSQPEESQPEESQPEESQPEQSQPEESQPEESQPAQSQSESPEGSVQAATGTPAASTPNTAFGGDSGNPMGTLLFTLILVGSLGALAYANVRTVRRQL